MKARRISCKLGLFSMMLFSTSLFILLTVSQGNCQKQKFNVIGNWLQYSDASNSLYHYLADQAYDQLAKRDSIISQIKTLPDWKQRQNLVRKTLMDIVSPFPEKTPLNARITKRIKKEDYTIENIIFESQPGFYVTSSLFIPNGLRDKAPAILDVIGHSTTSYRRPIYQHEILNLVKKGFIVLAYDPVGQGERIQYYNQKTGKSSVGGSTHEHSYPGAQAFITGSSQAMYEIWDGIRAVDYLLSRKEVDPDRIGVTGLSGGGTQSAYIGAFDNRVHAAAPANYITNYARLIQSIGPQDAEQNFYHGIVRGLDHADLLVVRAPKPTLMITTTRDFFSIQGAMETAKEVRRVFDAYGKRASFRMVEDDAPHSFTKKNNEAMYAFFQKYLNNPGDSEDLDIKPLAIEDLQVTKTGQVSTSFKDAETVFSLNLKEAKKRINRLQSKRKNLSEYLPKVLKLAKELSGYQKPEVYHKPVFTGRYQKEGYVIEKYFVKGEGDYVIPYLLMVPDKPNGRAVICLNPRGKSEEVNNGNMKWFVQKGFTVLAPDLLGIGELGHGDFKGNAFIGNMSYGKWFLSILIGRSIVGIQTGDIVRLVNLLENEKNIDEVYGLARESMCSVMLYASAFDKRIKRICLINPLSSYRSIVMSRFYDPRFIYGAVAGALKSYDLPDLAASLAPRKLMMIDIVDGRNKQINKKSDKEDISVIKAAYHSRGVDDQLNIIYGETENIPNIFSDWIN